MNIKKPGRRTSTRKRNPSRGFMAILTHMIPFLSGGSLGVLDAVAPEWWRNLPEIAKSLVITAAGFFFESKQAGKQRNEQLGNSLKTMGAYYAGRVVGEKGVELYREHTAGSLPQQQPAAQSGPQQQGEQGLGAFFDRSPEYAQLMGNLNAEMDAVANAYGLEPDPELGAVFGGYGGGVTYNDRTY